jgi:hypothetical protein
VFDSWRFHWVSFPDSSGTTNETDNPYWFSPDLQHSNLSISAHRFDVDMFVSSPDGQKVFFTARYGDQTKAFIYDTFSSGLAQVTLLPLEFVYTDSRGNVFVSQVSGTTAMMFPGSLIQASKRGLKSWINYKSNLVDGLLTFSST